MSETKTKKAKPKKKRAAKTGPPGPRPKPKPRPKKPKVPPVPTYRPGSGHWHRRGVVGRLSALTPSMLKSMVELLREGNYRRVVAEAHGISAETFRRWFQKGLADLSAKEDTLEADFASQVTIAEAEAHVSMVGVIVNQARAHGEYRAALEFLSRRYPREWAKVDRLTVTGDEKEDPIQLAINVKLYGPLLDRIAESIREDQSDAGDSSTDPS